MEKLSETDVLRALRNNFFILQGADINAFGVPLVFEEEGMQLSGLLTPEAVARWNETVPREKEIPEQASKVTLKGEYTDAGMFLIDAKFETPDGEINRTVQMIHVKREGPYTDFTTRIHDACKKLIAPPVSVKIDVELSENADPGGVMEDLEKLCNLYRYEVKEYPGFLLEGLPEYPKREDYNTDDTFYHALDDWESLFRENVDRLAPGALDAVFTLLPKSAVEGRNIYLEAAQKRTSDFGDRVFRDEIRPERLVSLAKALPRLIPVVLKAHDSPGFVEGRIGCETSLVYFTASRDGVKFRESKPAKAKKIGPKM